MAGGLRHRPPRLGAPSCLGAAARLGMQLCAPGFAAGVPDGAMGMLCAPVCSGMLGTGRGWDGLGVGRGGDGHQGSSSRRVCCPSAGCCTQAWGLARATGSPHCHSTPPQHPVYTHTPPSPVRSPHPHSLSRMGVWSHFTGRGCGGQRRVTQAVATAHSLLTHRQHSTGMLGDRGGGSLRPLQRASGTRGRGAGTQAPCCRRLMRGARGGGDRVRGTGRQLRSPTPAPPAASWAVGPGVRAAQPWREQRANTAQRCTTRGGGDLPWPWTPAPGSLLEQPPPAPGAVQNLWGRMPEGKGVLQRPRGGGQSTGLTPARMMLVGQSRR